MMYNDFIEFGLEFIEKSKQFYFSWGEVDVVAGKAKKKVKMTDRFVFSCV